MPLPSRSTQLLMAVVIALAAITGCKKREAAPEGDILATLEAIPVDGGKFDATSLRGKPCLVMFVSPTCPHCVEELPAAAAAAKAKGANVVAIFIAGKAENAKGVVEHTGFDGIALVDSTGALRRRYGVRSVPLTFVLGPDGYAREQFRGGQGESTLADALADAR